MLGWQSPTHFDSIEQKQEHDNVLCSGLLRKFQDNDSVSIKLEGIRTKSENDTEVTDYYLLIEIRVKESCQMEDLLDHIAGISAQFTPIHNQTRRYKVDLPRFITKQRHFVKSSMRLKL